jgi:hypothetical protein
MTRACRLSRFSPNTLYAEAVTAVAYVTFQRQEIRA